MTVLFGHRTARSLSDADTLVPVVRAHIVESSFLRKAVVANAVG
jgi:hypothetical protein